MSAHGYEKQIQRLHLSFYVFFIMNNIQYRILAGFAIVGIITQSLLGGGLGSANAAVIGSGTVQ